MKNLTLPESDSTMLLTFLYLNITKAELHVSGEQFLIQKQKNNVFFYVYCIPANEYILPWKSKDYFLNGFSVKTIVLVGIYNQQFKGTILFMVFDFQGTMWLMYVDVRVQLGVFAIQNSIIFCPQPRNFSATSPVSRLAVMKSYSSLSRSCWHVCNTQRSVPNRGHYKKKQPKQ